MTTQRVHPPAQANVEDRYRLLVEAVADYAIYMLDPGGIVVSWNTGARRFKGYSDAEIIGRHFSTFYRAEDRQNGLPDHALATARREGKYEAEGWRVRKDGAQFWAHVIIDPILDASGKLIGYAKITRDLTERRQAAEQLRRSEEQFRLLVQSVTDYAIYMLDVNGNVTNWNAGAERIKGYTADEIVGQHFSTFYTPEDRALGSPQKSLASAARDGRFETESPRMRKDGTTFWAHVVIDPIRSETGEIIGYAKITRDITERRLAQEALERTREQLMQSQKMEAIGRLTGGVAHDFNNLLMAITGSLELIKNRMPPDPRLTQFLENALMGAQRGITLTQRMLAFARRQDLVVEPTDLAGLIRGMHDLLQRSLGPDINIETDFPREPVCARVDPNQLELAILNLAVNARDAMPGGGNLKFALSRSSRPCGTDAAPQDVALLSITDTGEGMDAATLARATEPFFTTKGVGKGTGLGLSMVHGMADQLGGSLALQSSVGMGTTAELCFPIAEPAVRVASQASHVVSPNGLHLTVLVVDDDPLVLLNTTAMLEELGHTPIAAHSGAKALELLKFTAVDLVITDHAMPKMTGAELARAIASERPDLPIILATGYAELPKGEGVELPRLQKPFDMHSLAREIAKRFDAR
jgi:PAS domain S-box-containing protein